MSRRRSCAPRTRGMPRIGTTRLMVRADFITETPDRGRKVRKILRGRSPTPSCVTNRCRPAPLGLRCRMLFYRRVLLLVALPACVAAAQRLPSALPRDDGYTDRTPHKSGYITVQRGVRIH